VPIPDEATLHAWASEGRFNPSDLIYHPLLGRWLYARDVLEIGDLVERSAARIRQMEIRLGESKESALPADFIIRRRDGEFRAPDAATLRQWYSQGLVPPDTYIYHPVLARWMYPREVADLVSGATTRQISVPEMAANYRQLLVWLGIQILFSLAMLVVSVAIPILLAPLVLAVFITVATTIYYTYRTAESLGSAYSVLWALAMFIPVVNLIVLFALSTDARGVCAAHGIEVGFLGPRVR